MELFRKLAGNIFFKIILAFVALTFVLFGVSGFILGNPGNWIAKVGNKTIGYNTFNKALQNNRNLIMANSRTESVLKYLDSEQFKSDTLSRLVNQIMFEKLEDEYGIHASKDLVLESIVKNPNFRDETGKFNRDIFQRFLSQNGFDEERYVKEVSQDIIATMVIETLAMAAPINKDFIKEVEDFKQESRVADIIKISGSKIKNITAPNKQEIEEFYEQNKENYQAPEMRVVSYLYFSKNDFSKDLKISDTEIKAFYEQNKDNFKEPESRDFLHALFENKKSAEEFLDKLKSSSESNPQLAFINLARETLNKDQKTITLKEISKTDLIPELSSKTFELSVNENSEVLESPLGFHIFLLTKINESTAIPFAKAKEQIKAELSQGREDKIIKDKITQIDDELLTSNSLTKVAKKFGLKLGKKMVTIDQIGQNESGDLVKEIEKFHEFANNAFAIKDGQTSRIFAGNTEENSQEFYALKIEDVKPSHQKTLQEVKSKIIKQLLSKRKTEALNELGTKVSEELKKNPKLAPQIAAKYNLQFERNAEFPRVFFVNFQGRQIPYQNKFLDELFEIQIGQATSILPAGKQELIIGILKEIKTSKISGEKLIQAEKKSESDFKNEVLQEFNKYLLKKNPVNINKKVFGKTEEVN